MIKGTFRFYGLIGHPIEHSLSPAIHNYVFQRTGRPAGYGCFPAKNLKEAVKALSFLKFSGYNVTIPFKEKIIPWLDHVDKEARFMGAVNTVYLDRKKGACGFNTDGRGFLKSLQHFGFSPAKATALILGAGGAGRAVSFSLAGKKAAAITIYDCRQEKARHLVCDLKKAFPGIRINAAAAAQELSLSPVDLLVNATGQGLKKSDFLPIKLCHFKKSLIVYDLIYNPPQTGLLAEAARQRLTAINGLWMLIYQALEAQKIWYKEDVSCLARPLYRKLTRKG